MDLVNKYIDDTFEKNFFKIKDYPLFPQGKQLIDINNNNLIVYLDILYLDRISVIMPNEKKENYRYRVQADSWAYVN